MLCFIPLGAELSKHSGQLPVMLERYPSRLDDLRIKSFVPSKRILADVTVIAAGLYDGYDSEERGKLALVAKTANIINLCQQTHGYNGSDIRCNRAGNRVFIMFQLVSFFIVLGSAIKAFHYLLL